MPWMGFSQDLKFVENPDNYIFTDGYLFFEEIVVCNIPHTYTVEVEGGVPDYTYIWEYNPAEIQVNTNNNAEITVSQRKAKANIRVFDESGLPFDQRSISKWIHFYNDLYLDSLPTVLDKSKTKDSVILYQRPHKTVVEGPGIYYDAINKQYYLHPDSVAAGIYTAKLSYPNSGCANNLQNTIEYKVSNGDIEPLYIELLSPESLVFCEKDASAQLISMSPKGGNPFNDGTYNVYVNDVLIGKQTDYSAQVFAGTADQKISFEDANGSIVHKTISISTNPNPRLYLPGETIYEGGTHTFYVSTYNNIDYIWNTGEKTSAITVSVAGQYSVTVTNNEGCTASASARLNVNTTGKRFKFVENPDNYIFTDGYLFFEEIVVCNIPHTYTVEVEGGVPDYTYIWEYNPAEIQVNTNNNAEITVSQRKAKANIAVYDESGLSHPQSSISKWIHFYNDLYLDSLPTVLDKSKTKDSVILYQRPHKTVVEGPGIYYDAINKQYYLHPDSVAAGIYTAKLSYPNSGCANNLQNTIEYKVSNGDIEPLYIELLSPESLVFCEKDASAQLISMSPKGGNPFNDGTYNVYVNDVLIGKQTDYSAQVFAGTADQKISFEDANGSIVHKTISISTNPNPRLYLPGETIYEGGTHTFYVSTYNNIDYIWNTGEKTSAITVSVAGQYSVTVTNNEGCTASASARLNVNTTGKRFKFVENPDNYIFTDGYLFFEEIVVCNIPHTYTVEVEGGVPDYTYIWEYNPAEIQVNTNNNAEITVSQRKAKANIAVYDESGLSHPQSSISKWIHFYNDLYLDSLPTVLDKSKTKDSVILYQRPHKTVVEGPGIYYDAINKQYYLHPDSVAAGIYTAKLSYPNSGCANNLQNTIEYKVSNGDIEPLYIELLSPESLVFCEKDASAQLISMSPKGGNPFNDGTYNVYVNDVLIGKQTDYSAQVFAGTADQKISFEDANGSIVHKTISISTNPNPSVQLSDATVNEGETHTFAVSPAIFADYSWNTGEKTSSITVSVADQYSVTVANQDGCKAEASATLTVIENYAPLTVQVSSPEYLTFCQNDMFSKDIVMFPKGGNPFNDGTYNVYVNDVLIGKQADYSAQVFARTADQKISFEDADGNKIEKTIFIQTKPVPQVSLSGTTHVCEGQTTQLEAEEVAGGSYVWYKENDLNKPVQVSTNRIATELTSGLYYLVVTANGCSDSTGGIGIAYRPSPEVQLSDATINEGETHTFSPNPANFSDYIWSTGLKTETITVSQADQYSVTVTDNEGCTASASARLTVMPVCNLTVDFEVTKVVGANNTYAFESKTYAHSYMWTLPDNTIIHSKSSFTHTFQSDIEGEVCLDIARINDCYDRLCKPYNFAAPVHYSIEGTVKSNGNVIRCGKTIAYELVNNELIARDTVEINANGVFKHEDLNKGKYTVMAMPCESNLYQNTYYVATTDNKKAFIIDLWGNATSVDISLVKQMQTGTDLPEGAEFRVYPNPMTTSTTIVIENLEVQTIKVVNELGAIIQELKPTGSETILTTLYPQKNIV
jgi:hypothetical protein